LFLTSQLFDWKNRLRRKKTRKTQPAHTGSRTENPSNEGLNPGGALGSKIQTQEKARQKKNGESSMLDRRGSEMNRAHET
jgi:hypothetical protein